jgi:carbamate kinase
VGAVKSGYGTASEASLGRVTVRDVAAMTFDELSMGPKIEACIEFVRCTGRPAAIGALTEAEDVVLGLAGTTIVPGREAARA